MIAIEIKTYKNLVKRALSRNLRLMVQLEKYRWYDDTGCPWWQSNEAQLHNVVMKLPKGHAAYELSELWHDESGVYSFCTIIAIPEVKRQDFEGMRSGFQCLWAELGSRGFQRSLGKPVPPCQVAV